MRIKNRWSLIEELDPPLHQLENTLRDTRRLRGMSNAMGFSLACQQVVATIAVVLLVAVGGLLQLLWSGHFTIEEYWNRVQNFQQYDTISSLLLNMVCYFTYMFVPFILLAFWLKKNPLGVVPTGPIRQKRHLPVALVISLALSFLSALVAIYMETFLGFLHLRAVSPDTTPPPAQSVAAVVLYIVFFCVLAPLCEEFIFRGLILQSLRPYGNGFAILFSSLLFAMLHGNLMQFPLAFLVGLAFGFFVIQFKSIWATVLMHASVNLLAVMIDYLELQEGTAIANLLYLGLGITLLAIAIVAVAAMRSHKPLRERFAHATHARLPISFLMKRAFLTPGMIVFTVLFILLCVSGLRLT